MVNFGTFDTDLPAGFTVENAIRSSSGFSSEEETSPVRSFAWVVDNAIKSDSEEETSALRSFASVVDSAINSDGAEDVEDDFRLFTRTQIMATCNNNFSLEAENEIGQSCSGNTIRRSFQDFSWSNHTGDPSLLNFVSANGKRVSNRVSSRRLKNY